MSFPSVKWCVVCEDVRHEQQGLVSLMGFYGVLPDVRINVRNFGLPLAGLSFVLLAEGTGDGKKHRTRFQVIGPNGEIVLPGNESIAESRPEPVRIQTAITAMNPRLPGPGLYYVVFEVDDQEHFKKSFSVVLDPQAR